MFEEKFLFYRQDNMYLHVQTTDGGYDYTLYKKSHVDDQLAYLHDGGVIESEGAIYEAIGEIETMFDLTPLNKRELSQADFEAVVEVE